MAASCRLTDAITAREDTRQRHYVSRRCKSAKVNWEIGEISVFWTERGRRESLLRSLRAKHCYFVSKEEMEEVKCFVRQSVKMSFLRWRLHYVQFDPPCWIFNPPIFGSFTLCAYNLILRVGFLILEPRVVRPFRNFHS